MTSELGVACVADPIKRLISIRSIFGVLAATPNETEVLPTPQCAQTARRDHGSAALRLHRGLSSNQGWAAGDVKPAKPAKPKIVFFTHQKSDPTDQAKQAT